MNTNKVLESSLKVGSDNSVGASCDTQTVSSENNEAVALNLQRSATAEVQRPSTKPIKFVRPQEVSKHFNIQHQNWQGRLEDP